MRLLGVPVSGYASDLLIGARCVASIETSAVTLGEAGTAPRFVAAVAVGSIRVIDATCPAIHTMLQAAEKGVPFMPLRGVLGSDLLVHRPDWKVIENPFAGGGDSILLLPALAPDVAAFHAVCADVHGNVYVGRRRELATMAHAARRTLVTVERMVDGNMLDDEGLAAGKAARLGPGNDPGQPRLARQPARGVAAVLSVSGGSRCRRLRAGGQESLVLRGRGGNRLCLDGGNRLELLLPGAAHHQRPR